VTVENIEEEHSTRNARLMRMMEDMHLVENRGSGIRAMLHAMREANMEPPRFDDRRSSFRVVFMNHTLMNPEAVVWLNQFRGLHLDDRQRLALVYLRHHDAITNSEYRRPTHVDALVAGQELRALVQAGLVEQRGAGRWTDYTLKAREAGPPKRIVQPDQEKILAYVKAHGSINNTECRKLLGVDLHRASYLLGKLLREGILKRKGERKWMRNTLP
jgi:ATP-dependent DNA helicase RecG